MTTTTNDDDPADDELRERRRLSGMGYRFVHAASARKHRKQGHHVRYVPALRCYAWISNATGDTK